MTSKKRKTLAEEPRGKRLRTTQDEETNVRCWCSHLHRLAYPKLVAFAAMRWDIPVAELKRLSKSQICHLIAQRMNIQIPENEIKEDIIEFLDASSATDIEAMDQMKNFTGTCEPSFAVSEEGRQNVLSQRPFGLSEYMDHVSQSPLVDFVKLLPEDKQLFNWSTIKRLSSGRHPLTNVTLPLNFAKNVKPTSDLADRLARLHEEWGFNYQPQLAEQLPEEELKQIPDRRIAYQPLSPPRPMNELPPIPYDPMDEIEAEQRQLDALIRAEREEKERRAQIQTEFSPITLQNSQSLRSRVTFTCFVRNPKQCSNLPLSAVDIKDYLMHLFPQISGTLDLREGKSTPTVKKYFWLSEPWTNPNQMQVILDLGTTERKWIPFNGRKPIKTNLNGTAPLSFYVSLFVNAQQSLTAIKSSIETTLRITVAGFQLERESTPVAMAARVNALPKDGRLVKPFLKCLF